MWGSRAVKIGCLTAYNQDYLDIYLTRQGTHYGSNIFPNHIGPVETEFWTGHLTYSGCVSAKLSSHTSNCPHPSVTNMADILKEWPCVPYPDSSMGDPVAHGFDSLPSTASYPYITQQGMDSGVLNYTETSQPMELTQNHL